MNWDELLKINGNIKVELSLTDLKSFADYVIKNASDNNTAQQKHEFDIGGIDVAIEVLGYAKSTIYNMCNSGKLPYFRKHGRLYFSRSDLLSFIKSGKEETIDETIYKHLK